MKMKKTTRTNANDGNKRPPYKGPGFWIAKGEAVKRAKVRAWMTPGELDAWDNAKTEAARDKVEAAARIAAEAEWAADAARRQANVKRNMARAYALRAEAAEHERQVQDDIHTLAEAARAKTPTKRKPGPGRKPYYDAAMIKRVESTIAAQGGRVKAAAEVLGMAYREALAIHEAARKRRGRKA